MKDHIVIIVEAIMFNSKCVLAILIFLFRNRIYLCEVRINEIKLHEKSDAFVELAFVSCKGNCSSSSLALIVLQEDADAPKSCFIISDIIKLKNIIYNEHGLVTIDRRNTSNFKHQFNYNSSLLHGLALLQYVDSEQNNSDNLDRFLADVRTEVP